MEGKLAAACPVPAAGFICHVTAFTITFNTLTPVNASTVLLASRDKIENHQLALWTQPGLSSTHYSPLNPRR